LFLRRLLRINSQLEHSTAQGINQFSSIRFSIITLCIFLICSSFEFAKTSHCTAYNLQRRDRDK
jgi:hypothetical protein